MATLAGIAAHSGPAAAASTILGALGGRLV